MDEVCIRPGLFNWASTVSVFLISRSHAGIFFTLFGVNHETIIYTEKQIFIKLDLSIISWLT